MGTGGLGGGEERATPSPSVIPRWTPGQSLRAGAEPREPPEPGSLKFQRDRDPGRITQRGSGRSPRERVRARSGVGAGTGCRRPDPEAGVGGAGGQSRGWVWAGPEAGAAVGGTSGGRRCLSLRGPALRLRGVFLRVLVAKNAAETGALVRPSSSEFLS